MKKLSLVLLALLPLGIEAVLNFNQDVENVTLEDQVAATDPVSATYRFDKEELSVAAEVNEAEKRLLASKKVEWASVMKEKT